MNLPEEFLQDDDSLLGELPPDPDADALATFPDAAGPAAAPAVAPPARPKRDLSRLMRKIPVTVTLEVGAAKISLQELAGLSPDSVIELDAIAGEPLTIKVNGTAIGRAEVVVSGENYGLKVTELSDLDLDSLAS